MDGGIEYLCTTSLPADAMNHFRAACCIIAACIQHDAYSVYEKNRKR